MLNLMNNYLNFLQITPEKSDLKPQYRQFQLNLHRYFFKINIVPTNKFLFI